MSQFYRRPTINQSLIILYLQNENLHTIVNISTVWQGYEKCRRARLRPHVRDRQTYGTSYSIIGRRHDNM